MVISSNIVNLIQRLIHAAIFCPKHRSIICQLAAPVVNILTKGLRNAQCLIGKLAVIRILYKCVNINQPGQHFVQIIPGHDHVLITAACPVCLIQDTLPESGDIACTGRILCRIGILAFLQPIDCIPDLCEQLFLGPCILRALISLGKG